MGFDAVPVEGVGALASLQSGQPRYESPEPIQNRHLLMARAQILRPQVQVALRRGDLRVSEHHREADDVPALAEVVRRERVAEAMPAEHRQPELALQQVQATQAVALIPC